MLLEWQIEAIRPGVGDRDRGRARGDFLALTNEKSPRPFGPGAGQATLVAGERSQCDYAALSSYFVISSLTPAAA
jgi:hypothetical protein